MFKKDKKAQANMPIGSMIMLIIGVGVGVLSLIFIGVLGGQTYNLTESQIEEIGNRTVYTKLITPTENVTFTLNSPIRSGTFTARNASNSSEIYGSGNYTLNAELGTFTLINYQYSGSQSNLSYEWGNRDVTTSIKNSIVYGFNALEQTGLFLPIIVLAVVITIVLGAILGMLFVSTTGLGRRGGGVL